MASIGRFAVDKGLDTLVAAWPLVVARHPEVTLLLIGRMDEREPASPSVLQFVSSRVGVHVVPITDQVAKYLAAMDIFVLPTLREGFPSVLLEAGAMSLARVASRVTGCVDAIRDGHDGSLVTPRDAAELAAAILRYCDNAALRREHGVQARTRIRAEFSSDRVVAAQMQRYGLLLDSTLA